MDRAIELAIRMTADASDVERSLGSAGSAAKSFGDDVDKAARMADDAGSKMAGAAEGIDDVGSKSAQAAGGLGDLGGALGLLPGPLGALGAGMESVAPAIMGVTGAADLASLAMGSNVVQTTKAAVATARHTAVTAVQTTATKAQAVAQRALNIAMRANPIGLIITAAIALAAGLVVLYKRSETFRNIVDKAGRVGRQALGWVVDKAQALVGWIKNLPENLTKFSDKAGIVSDLAVGYFKVMTTPIRTVLGLIKDIVSWIGKIDFPDLPGGLGGILGRSVDGRPGTPGGFYAPVPITPTKPAANAASAAPQVIHHTTVNINVNGAVDRLGTARQIIDLLRAAGVVLGAPTGSAVFG